MMCKNGMVTYHDMIPGLNPGEQFIWTLSNENIPAQAAEAVKNERAAYLEEANK
ncbi:MAG: hypothetical protein J6D08_03945 [Lachnospiraceae bacterium]|nr:hypothetical protein [Lachnospiraceae bacterium]